MVSDWWFLRIRVEHNEIVRIMDVLSMLKLEDSVYRMVEPTTLDFVQSRCLNKSTRWMFVLNMELLLQDVKDDCDNEAKKDGVCIKHGAVGCSVDRKI